MTAPGAELAERAADPVRLLAGLAGWNGPVPYAEHVRRHGPLPRRRGAAADPRLLDFVERSGLLGRGGAGFPTGRKMRAVAEHGRRPVVVANGMEGEPVSRKDAVLLGRLPHLVLDGVVLAARAVGASEAYLCVHSGAATLPVLHRAVSERDPDADGVAVGIEQVPAGYVAGEASALVHWLDGGAAVPLFSPRPHARGVRGRPTLVQNVETLANVAMVARFGPGWLRAVGEPQEPGSLLVTVAGAVSRPGVVEVASGTPIGPVLARAGAEPHRLSAVLVGGYYGGWLPVGAALGLPLSHRALRSLGLGLGAGILVALPAAACGLRPAGDRAGGRVPRRRERRPMWTVPVRPAVDCGRAGQPRRRQAGPGGGRRNRTLVVAGAGPRRLPPAGWCGPVRRQCAADVPCRRDPARPVGAVPRCGAPAGAARCQPRSRLVSPARLRLNPVACGGHGLCADLLPEMISLDEWGYPVVDDRDVPADLLAPARRAVNACPTLALALARQAIDAPPRRASRPYPTWQEGRP
jgi:ferredoxin